MCSIIVTTKSSKILRGLTTCGVMLLVALLLHQSESKPSNPYVGNFYEGNATVLPKEGDPCVIRNYIYGKCKAQSKCANLASQMKQLSLQSSDVGHCGFTAREEIICCPTPTAARGFFEYNATNAVGTPERKAVKACREIEKDAEPSLEPLVIGGSPVQPGEYPHMAAIGYTALGSSEPPYVFACGGSLIDKRFVLTAAHCVNRRDLVASIVRLGVTDLEDTDMEGDVLDIPIKLVHIHPSYNNLHKYDDIALIELTRDVQYTNTIYPACLHTDLADPPPNAVLNITGWGVTDLAKRVKSRVLLEARVNIVRTDSCNASYAREGVPLSRGVLDTQLCTHDSQFKSDACKGDSGGPLNWITDAYLRKMRIVGVVSAGAGCAGSTPSLYTRVASYLGFIESIVWA